MIRDKISILNSIIRNIIEIKRNSNLVDYEKLIQVDKLLKQVLKDQITPVKTLAELEKEYIIKALTRSKTLKEASELLGISIKTLQIKIHNNEDLEAFYSRNRQNLSNVKNNV